MIRERQAGLITMPTYTAQVPAIHKPRPSHFRRVVPAAKTPDVALAAAAHAFRPPVVREIRRAADERASTAALW